MNLLQKNYVKYGLAMCGVIVVCLTLMEITGQNKSFDKSPFQLIFMLIAPAVIWYLGIRAKKKSQKNKITYKDGLIEGIKISLTYALISPFIFLLYYLLINPEIVNSVGSAYGLSSSSHAVIILVDMLGQVVAATIFGTLYAAVIALFLKSKLTKKKA